MVKKTLSTRTHVCPECRLVLDRDHNAAINILQKARDRTVGQTGTGKHRACETLLDIRSLLIASDRDEQIG